MVKLWIWGLITVTIIFAGYVFIGNTDRQNSNIITGDAIALSAENPYEEPALRIFVLRGENFKFSMNGIDNPIIKVKKGDRVRIEFSSTSGTHDWFIDEFLAATERVNIGEITSVEFIADKKGTFEYYCSVGQHRANGMKGSLVVE